MPTFEVFTDNLSLGVGYVKQEPWLQEGTIRDNILFGTVYQHTWYSRVGFSLPAHLVLQGRILVYQHTWYRYSWVGF